MAAPDWGVKVEFAPVGPWAYPIPESSWFDWSPWVEAVEVHEAGRKSSLDSISAATATITLDNTDRRFDPINPDTPYRSDGAPLSSTVGTHNEANTGTITITPPSGTVEGDLLLGFIASQGNIEPTGVTTPAALDGNQIVNAASGDNRENPPAGGDARLVVYARQVEAGDPSSWSVSMSLASGQVDVAVRYRNFFEGSGWQEPAVVVSDGWLNSGTFPDVVVPFDGSKILYALARRPTGTPGYDDTVNCPGTTKLLDQLNAGQGHGLAIFERDAPSAGFYAGPAVSWTHYSYVAAAAVVINPDGFGAINYLQTDTRVRISLGGTEDRVCGVIDSFDIEDDPPDYSRAVISCTDRMKQTAAYEFAQDATTIAFEEGEYWRLLHLWRTPSEQTAADWVDAVLDELGCHADDRSIGEGLVPIETTTTQGQFAQDFLRAITRAEWGAFFFDRSGVPTFVGRHARFSDPRQTTPQYVITDQPGAGELLWSEAPLVRNAEEVRNVARFSTAGGYEATREDPGSIALHGKNVYAVSDLDLKRNRDADANAELVIYQYGDLDPHFSSVTVDCVDENSDEFTALLDLRFSDRVTIEQNDIPGGGDPIAVDEFVQRIHWKATPSELSYRLDLEPAGVLDFIDPTAWITVGTTKFGDGDLFAP